MVGRRAVCVGTAPVSGTGRINFASVTTGAAIQPGDELYIIATATDTTVSAVPTFGSTPAGWTKLEDESGGTRTRYGLFYKVADGTEGNVDVTATGSGTIDVGVGAIAISGGARNAALSADGSIGTSTWNTADVTTEEEWSHVFAFVGARSNGSFTPTDCIEHVDTSAGGTLSRVGIFEQMTKDPSTRDIEGTTSGTTTEPWAFVIVVEPTTDVFSDSFGRTENPIASGWGPFTGFAASALQADGSQLRSSGVGNNASHITQQFERDAQIECTVATKGNNSEFTSLFLRINNPSSGSFNCLELRYEPLAGTDTLKIFRWVSGSATQVGSTINQEIANGDKIRFKAIGTHYSVEVDTGSGFTEVGSADDTGSVVTRGWAGIRCNNTTQRLDDVAFQRIDREGHAEYIHAITSGGSTTAASTNNITLPIAYPGDTWLLHVHTFKQTAGDIDVSIPDFTQVGSFISAQNSTHEFFLFKRVCDGTEGAVDAASIVKVATATGTNPANTRWRTGAISVIADDSDTFTIDPFNENEGTAATTWATDSITQTAGDLLVTVVHHQGTNTNTATNDDAAAVETQDSASNSSGTHTAVYIKRIVSGTTDDATGTLSGSNVWSTYIYTVKAVAVAPTVDSGTITLTFTPSTVEVFEAVDAATITLLFTPSGVDEYTGGGTEYTDSGTINLIFTPSGTELQADEYTDSGTVTLVLTPSGVEQQAPQEPILASQIDDFERASLGSDWSDFGSGSGVQIYGSSDLGSSDTGNRGTYYNVETHDPLTDELQAWIEITTLPTGSNYFGPFISSNPGSALFNGYFMKYDPLFSDVLLVKYAAGAGGSSWSFDAPSLSAGDYLVLQRLAGSAGTFQLWKYSGGTWTYIGTATDTSYTDPMYVGVFGRGTGWRVESVGGGVPSAAPEETTDSGTIYLTLTPSGVDDYIEPGGVYNDAATFYLDLQPSGTEVLYHSYTETGTINLVFTVSGTDYVHQCKPRFRGELLTWLYDPDAMRAEWYGGLLIPEWHGELLTVEMVANYAC